LESLFEWRGTLLPSQVLQPNSKLVSPGLPKPGICERFVNDFDGFVSAVAAECVIDPSLVISIFAIGECP
jgi:hypothetical protein